MTRSRNGLLLSLLVGLLPGILAHAQAPPAAPTPVQLVQQLASDSFEVREQALQQLKKLGRSAVPALRQGLGHSDREVRLHCEDLLPLAQRSKQDAALEAFVLGNRDPRAAPLVGWDRLQKLAGNDFSARLLYVRLYRADKKLLELLETNPDQLRDQWLQRARQLEEIGSGASTRNPSAVAAVNGLLLVGCLGTIDNARFNQFRYLVSRNQIIPTEARQSPATQRLMSRMLSARNNEFHTLWQNCELIDSFDRHGALAGDLKEAVKKHAAAALKSEDLSCMEQCAALAVKLEMGEVIEGMFRPVLVKLAEKAAQAENAIQIQQVASLAETLHSQDITDAILKPAAGRCIRAAADKVRHVMDFYRPIDLAQATNQMELFNSVMRPAAVRLISEAADNLGHPLNLQTAMQLTQMMNLEEAVEGVLRPAGRRRMLAALEKPGDWNEISTAIVLCQQLQLNDLLRDTVTPVFLKHARTLLESNDVSRLCQVYKTCQQVGANEFIEKQLKPALRRYFVWAKDQTLHGHSLDQALYLARAAADERSRTVGSEGDNHPGKRPRRGGLLCREAWQQGTNSPAGAPADRHDPHCHASYRLSVYQSSGA